MCTTAVINALIVARTRIAFKSMPIHHPIGITVEIVGIEANTNGRSCDQHDVCGSALEDDVVVRLRKVQILNAEGREESAIAAYLVSDGIDQCRVGFLQRHLVRHAKSFDGVLAQVTEVYSATSESPAKRRKCLHNMGCCLAAVISAMPPLASSSVNKIAMREDVSDEDHAMIEMLGENNNGSNDAASTSSDKAEDYSISNKAHAPPLCQEGQNKECNHSTPILKKDNPTNGNSSKRKTDDLTLAPAALVFTPPPPANTPQRTRAQTKKAGGLMTTPPPLAINEEPHCTVSSTKQSKKSGKKDKPKRKAGDLALPSSGLSASASGTKKVKRVEAKDKK
jgi:hypothetical protein